MKDVLERLGFQRQSGRERFPRIGRCGWDRSSMMGETFLLHVHVIPASSPEVDELRFFRTCLRADSELLKAYVAKKKAILAGGVTRRFGILPREGEVHQGGVGVAGCRVCARGSGNED